MKKNRILLILIILLGIFVLKQDVYADEIAGYNWAKIEFNIYNETTKQFEKQEGMSLNYLINGEGIIIPYETIKKGEDVYVIDDKAILVVPKKSGYYFSGWYLDENYENSFLTSKIDKSFKELDLKLYGKWVKEEPNNTTYKFGEEVYILGFRSCGYYSCNHDIAKDYIYLSSTKQLSNEKSRNNDFPTELKLAENDTFLGWYDDRSYVKGVDGYAGCVKFSNQINDLNGAISSSKSGKIVLYADWQSFENELKEHCNSGISNEPTPTPESTSDPKDDTTTIGAKDNTNDIATSNEKNSDNNNLLLYIGIFTIIVGVLFLGIVISSDRNKKNN